MNFALWVLILVNGAPAFAIGTECYPRWMNQDRLNGVVARFSGMAAPDFKLPAIYTCTLIKGLGCAGTEQVNLPLKVRIPNDGGVPFAPPIIDVAWGFPGPFRARHLFYQHRKMVLAHGRLFDLEGQITYGHVREAAGELIVLLTNPRPPDAPAKQSGDFDPAHFDYLGHAENIMDALVCEPNAKSQREPRAG